MGRYHDEITVSLVADDKWGLRPASFTWRGAMKRVREVQDCWCEVGRWWEQEEEQTVWRIRTTDGGLFEIGMVHTKQVKWFLIYSWD